MLNAALTKAESSGTFPGRETVELTDQLRYQRGKSFVRLTNGMTHYELSGPQDGRVVVLVHGASLSLWVWDRQVDALHQAGFRTLRYDQYGRGLSEYPQIKFTKDLYRLQLLELLDTLGIVKPVDIIGHSAGGFVTTYFTSKHPQRVNKIIYVAPGVKVTKTMLMVMHSFLRPLIVRANLRTVPANIDNILTKQGIPLEPYRRIYLEQLTYKGFEASVNAMFAGSIDDYQSYYRQVGREIKNILVIWGDSDTIIKFSGLKLLQSLIPHIRPVVMEGVGHVPHFEATERFNKVIVDFLLE